MDKIKRTGISPGLIDLRRDVEMSFNLYREKDEFQDDDEPKGIWELIIIP